MRNADNIFMMMLLQVPEADAGHRRDLRQQADLHLQDRGPGHRDPAQPHSVIGILHKYQGMILIVDGAGQDIIYTI